MIKAIRRDATGVAPLKDQGKLIQDPIDKATILKKQFQSVVSPSDTVQLLEMGYSPYSEMPNITITTSGVVNLLENINPHKSSGPDKILPHTLKQFSTEIGPILTIILNKSLTSSMVPDDWRKANVTPIFKKGERYKPSNYRPISLTCICCKIQEHILTSNIMSHLENQYILYKWQHGFRARHSTETQLTTFIHELSRNLDHRTQTDLRHTGLSTKLPSNTQY